MIAQTVSELQHYIEIQDGGVRHVGFRKNCVSHYLL